MKKIIIIFFLLLLASGLAESYEYHMPVNVQCTMTPAVLLPGDEAILAIEMANGGASYGTGRDTGLGSYVQASLSPRPSTGPF